MGALTPDVQALDEHRFRLGEGGRWSGTDFWQVDLLDGELWRASGGAGPLVRELAVGMPLGAMAETTGGGRVVIAGTGVALVTGDGALDWRGRPVDGLEPARRVNDAAVSGGRLFFGTMDFSGTVGNGALWRADPDGSVTRLLDGLGTPNGPAVTPDGTVLYLADSSVGRIQRFRLSPDFSLGDATTFAQLDPADGVPDGMTVDADGYLWVALWDGAAVAQFDPEGRRVGTVALPMRRPTSVTIAGDRMIVTSAWEGLADRNDWDGATVAFPSPAEGTPAGLFG